MKVDYCVLQFDVKVVDFPEILEVKNLLLNIKVDFTFLFDKREGYSAVFQIIE